MNDNQKAADLLAAAADLIAKPGAWTQGALARTAKGNRCAPTSRRAVCWCALGALDRFYDADSMPGSAILQLNKMTGFNIPGWQDDPARNQGDVVRLLRRAAKKLRSEP